MVQQLGTLLNKGFTYEIKNFVIEDRKEKYHPIPTNDKILFTIVTLVSKLNCVSQSVPTSAPCLVEDPSTSLPLYVAVV